MVASEIKAKALLVNVQNRDDFKAISEQVKKAQAGHRGEKRRAVP